MKMLRALIIGVIAFMSLAAVASSAGAATVNIAGPQTNWVRANNLTLQGPAVIVGNVTLAMTIRTGNYTVSAAANQLIQIGAIIRSAPLATSQCQILNPAGLPCVLLFGTPTVWPIMARTNAAGAIELTAAGRPLLTILGAQFLITAGVALQILCSGSVRVEGNANPVTAFLVNPALGQSLGCINLVGGGRLQDGGLTGQFNLQLGGYRFTLS